MNFDLFNPMMDHCAIKEIRSDEAAAYKTFFLRGLVLDEESYRIAPDDDREAPFPTQGREDSFTLGAYADQVLAGVVSLSVKVLTNRSCDTRVQCSECMYRETSEGRALVRNLWTPC